jgi:catechol 2,3-dioxygenase-like lactoylglutathione lyase family enzyme
MIVTALDHFNIITPDLHGTAAFYADILGLEQRDGPPPLRADQVQWMYDSANRAIVRINSVDCPRAYDREVAPGPTGAVHHIALRCDGFAAMKEKLDGRSIDHHLNEIPSVGLKQIFLHDPNDIVLELNFWE